MKKEFMNISLTPELEQFIARKVESGLYQTASEVIRDGLRLLRERDDLYQQKREDLRRELIMGIDQANQGKVAPFTTETLVRAKSRGRQPNKPNGAPKA
jgi:antitoxin ParD1/3/4